jgi:catechol 2,3-dioxygenase-like lactoylglutathione lyase family enzyme
MEDKMLSDKATYATIPVSDLPHAKHFYGETLGLKAVMDTEGGVMYGSGGTQFFVYPSRFKASGHTQMSWTVSDIKGEVAALKAKGIKFEDYDSPGIKTVDGIVQVGPAVWTAWFLDPDGNLLGLTQIG